MPKFIQKGTLVLWDFDLDLGIGPEEWANLEGRDSLLKLINLNNHIAQMLDILKRNPFLPGTAWFKRLHFFGLDHWQRLHLRKGIVRKVEFEVDVIEVDFDFGQGWDVDFKVVAVVDECGSEFGSGAL